VTEIGFGLPSVERHLVFDREIEPSRHALAAEVSGALRPVEIAWR
jgi:hypothetical protein